MSSEAPVELDAAARAEALSYKLRKEAFVSNLTGSSLTDINLVTLVATVCDSSHTSKKAQLTFFLCLVSCSALDGPVETWCPRDGRPHHAVHNRLSAQHLRHPLRLHGLCLSARLSEFGVAGAGHLAAASTAAETKRRPEQSPARAARRLQDAKWTTRPRRRRAPSRHARHPAVSDKLPRSLAHRDVPRHPGRRLSRLPATLRQGRDMGNLHHGPRRGQLCIQRRHRGR